MKTNDLILTVFIYLISSFIFLFHGEKGYLRIDILDVGQGDSILISTPNGKRVLIDGGDNFEPDFKISKLTPFYSCKLDAVILTHPHYDHIKGINRIMQRCKIGVVMFNDIDFTSRDFSYFKDNSSKLNTRNLLKGDEFEIDNVKFKILWPSKDFLQKGIADINDSSVVMLIDYGDFEGLLTGDATLNVLDEVDLDVVREYVDGVFEMIKIPHHGSKYSLDKKFYIDLKPKTCVISVGDDNRFGHPSLDVISFLESVGCNVLRTDMVGDVKIKVPVKD